MKNNPSLLSWTLITVLTALAQGCATGAKTKDVLESAVIHDASAIEHIVQKGDRLGDIANTYTGRIQDWKAIAEHNNINDPRALNIGDTIHIPRSLLPESQPTDPKASRKAARRESLDAASSRGVPANISASSTNSLAIKQRLESANNEVNVVVRPVDVNREFTLTPIDLNSLTGSSSFASAPPRVKVSGTYYPKGLYREPANHSSLVMRVAPGTVFELEREVNDWYKVVTDQGTAYLRTIDGTLLPSDG